MEDFFEKNGDPKQQLDKWFQDLENVVIIGIGNLFRKDDNIGVEIIRNLNTKVSNQIFLIEAETVPESYLQQIVEFNPSHILLIDAGLINQKPGTVQLVDPTKLIKRTAISTHTLPLRIFCDFIKQKTKAKILLLIIQPKDVSFGENLTPELEETAKKISNLLLKILP